MRFCLWIVATLVASLYAQNFLKLPQGLPNGAIITFKIWHVHTSFWFFPNADPVAINFYDQEFAVNDKGDINDNGVDIPAHLRIEKDRTYPVVSSTRRAGHWVGETVKEQPLDSPSPGTGWWTVDVIKHDMYHMNVFFRGYWSDIRTFKISLDNLRFLHVRPENNDPKNVQIQLKLPNSNIALLSITETYKFLNDHPVSYRKFITLPGFPIGARIDMIAVLRASGGAKTLAPSLLFSPVSGSTYAFKITQIWIARSWYESYPSTHELYITSQDPLRPTEERLVKSNPEQCTDMTMGPNGDLVHLRLERTSQNVIKMQGGPHYDPTRQKRRPAYQGNTLHVSCQVVMPADRASLLDRPIEIIGLDGALIYHLERTIPHGK